MNKVDYCVDVLRTLIQKDRAMTVHELSLSFKTRRGRFPSQSTIKKNVELLIKEGYVQESTYHAKHSKWKHYESTERANERLRQEHRWEHEKLHKQFDLLLADFLMHNKDKLPSTTTITELMNWSYEQTKNPTEVHR